METVEVVIKISKNTLDAIGILQEFVGDTRLTSGYQIGKNSTFGTMIKAIANGTVLPKENGFIAICKPNKPLPEDIKKSLKETLFIADEDCLYNFDMIEIIDTGQEAEHDS